MSMNDDQLRKDALARLKAKRGFWGLAGTFAIVSAILVGIWAMTGRSSHFWPMWPMFGMGIALAFAGWNAYGPRESISEADIQNEMRKMQGGG